MDPPPCTSGRRTRAGCSRDGLEYVDSWVDERLDRCFQLMRTDDPALFEEWTAR